MRLRVFIKQSEARVSSQYLFGSLVFKLFLIYFINKLCTNFFINYYLWFKAWLYINQIKLRDSNVKIVLILPSITVDTWELCPPSLPLILTAKIKFKRRATSCFLMRRITPKLSFFRVLTQVTHLA